MDHPLSLSSQLVQHLQALRKRRNLSQTALGKLVGVGQTRIADIEADPGKVSVDQLMAILRVLGADLVLRTQPPMELAGHTKAGTSLRGELSVGPKLQPGMQRLARSFGVDPSVIRNAMAEVGKKQGNDVTEDTPLDALTEEQVMQLAEMLGKRPRAFASLLTHSVRASKELQDPVLDRPETKGTW
jgi:transcriptional regulator with XRE-family HTH domain